MSDRTFGGPDAPLWATAATLTAAADASRVVLVEGISDHAAVEATALRLGRDLTADGVVIVPVGGAHAFTRHLRRFGPQGAGLDVVGMCDLGEVPVLCAGLSESGYGDVDDRAALESLGFTVCVADLEDELICAAGRRRIEVVLDANGDLGAFRTLQRQPEWRGAAFEAQMHRFLGAGARRKQRYARLLVGGMGIADIPVPLARLVERA